MPARQRLEADDAPARELQLRLEVERELAVLERVPQAYLWLSGGATLLAAPLAWIVFTDPRPAVYLPAVVAAELLLFSSTGLVNSVILNVVSPGERATAVPVKVAATERRTF